VRASRNRTASRRKARAGRGGAPGSARRARPWWSFDSIAPLYDATRTVDPGTFATAVDFLARRTPAARFPRALELGIGTGRLAVPIAERGYRVVGVDLSRPMLARLEDRRRRVRGERIDPIRGDVTRLPLRDARFDVAYWAHVLHLVPRWRSALREVVRTLRPGGAIWLLRTEGGPSIEALDREYERRVRAHRTRIPAAVGVRREATVLRHLHRLGFRRRARRTWRWRESVALRDAIHYLDARAYSRMRGIPLPVHRAVMRELRRWARRRWPAPRAVEPSKGFVRVTVLLRRRRPGLRRTRRAAA
jgi:ubiquinone/menaquinone biosynthesis C-methylase UbiE